MPVRQGRSTADTGITLPGGVLRTIFADKVGHARQMVVAPDGTLLCRNSQASIMATKPPPGVPAGAQGQHGHRPCRPDRAFRRRPRVVGGTGIGFYKGALYADQ
jgi:hypothetical protein